MHQRIFFDCLKFNRVKSCGIKFTHILKTNEMKPGHFGLKTQKARILPAEQKSCTIAKKKNSSPNEATSPLLN